MKKLVSKLYISDNWTIMDVDICYQDSDLVLDTCV